MTGQNDCPRGTHRATQVRFTNAQCPAPCTLLGIRRGTGAMALSADPLNSLLRLMPSTLRAQCLTMELTLRLHIKVTFFTSFVLLRFTRRTKFLTRELFNDIRRYERKLSQTEEMEKIFLPTATVTQRLPAELLPLVRHRMKINFYKLILFSF